MANDENFETVVVNIEQGVESARKKCPSCGLEVPTGTAVCPNDGTAIVLESANYSALGGKYQFLSVVGEGGMSVIYRARQLALDKTVAIKMLHGSSSGHSKTNIRFHQEARLASSLSHPNVIAVHDFGTTEHGQPFLVMDFIDGPSLAQLIRDEGPLRADRAVEIFIQMTAGLTHAHDKGILHRDLKPSNIMISRVDGADMVTLVDFGIAKMTGESAESQQLTKTGDLFGSPPYMSPEQCLGQKLDARSDIYALGCIMYEALTGVVPFLGESAAETIFKHLNEVPPKMAEVCDIPFSDDLEEIVARCLTRDPRFRYQTSEELHADLEAIRDDKPRPSKHQIQFSSGQTRLTLIGIVIALQIVFASVAAWHAFKDNAARSSEVGATNSHVQLAPPGTLDASMVDDAYLTKYLHQAGNVDKLILSKSRISPASMDEVRKQATLKMLYLDDTGVGDKALTRLQALPNLWYLNLNNTEITDQSIGTIRQFKKLTSLHVKDTQLSPHAIDILLQSLPECEIEK